MPAPQPIYLPQDPNSLLLQQAAQGLGQFAAGKATGQVSTAKKEKGLLELEFLKEYGGTYSEKQLGDIAKNLGMPTSVLMQAGKPVTTTQMEKDVASVTGKPKEFRYTFESKGERELGKYAKQLGIESAAKAARFEDDIKRLKKEIDIKTEAEKTLLGLSQAGSLKLEESRQSFQGIQAGVQRAFETKMAGSKADLQRELQETGAQARMDEILQQYTQDVSMMYANNQHALDRMTTAQMYDEKNIILRDKLSKKVSDLERRKIESEIGENKKHSILMKAQADVLSSGTKEEIVSYDSAWKKLKTIGALDKDGVLKPVKKDSQEYKQIIDIFEANGIEYDIISGDSSWGRERFLVVPKIGTTQTRKTTFDLSKMNPALVDKFRETRADPRFKDLSDEEIGSLVEKYGVTTTESTTTVPKKSVTKPVTTKPTPRTEPKKKEPKITEYDRKLMKEGRPTTGAEKTKAMTRAVRRASKEGAGKSGIEREALIKKFYAEELDKML